jgi:hypothetical protein
MPCLQHNIYAVSTLQEPSSIEKVAEIDEHIGCAMSGLTADAKTLVDHARADTQVRSCCAAWHTILLSYSDSYGQGRAATSVVHEQLLRCLSWKPACASHALFCMPNRYGPRTRRYTGVQRIAAAVLHAYIIPEHPNTERGQRQQW